MILMNNNHALAYLVTYLNFSKAVLTWQKYVLATVTTSFQVLIARVSLAAKPALAASLLFRRESYLFTKALLIFLQVQR